MMITGRIARHIKTQNWTAVFLDLLIVIVGVFIGLQVSNWNNERLSDIRSKQVTVHLKSDITEIHKQADVYVKIYTSRIESIKRLITFLASEQATPSDAKTFAKDLYAPLNASPAIPRSATVIELLASGDISLVKDEKVRFELIKLDQLIQTAELANNKINDIWIKYSERIINKVSRVNEVNSSNYAKDSETLTYDIEELKSDRLILPALSVLLDMNKAELTYRTQIRDKAQQLSEVLVTKS